MISVRTIDATIESATFGPWSREPWNPLASLADLAPEGAVAAVVNATLVKSGDPEWNSIPPDECSIAWIRSEENGQQLAGAALIGLSAVLAVGSIVFTGGAGLAFALSIGAAGYGLLILGTFFQPPALQALQTQNAPSPTYGFSGGINYQPANGRPIPVVYGKHLVGGLLLQGYREEGEDGNQRVHILLCLSQGPIEAVGDDALGTANLYTSAQDDLDDAAAPGGMWINEDLMADADVYANLITAVRLGSNSQDAIRFHEEIVNEYNTAYRLRKGLVFRYPTQGVCDRVGLHFYYPQGAYHGKITTSGLKPVADDWRCELDVFEADGSTLDFSRELHFRETQPQQFWRSFDASDADGMDPGKKVVQLEKTSSDGPRKERPHDRDETHVIAITEHQYVALQYNGLAMLAFATQANEKLSGGPPRLAVMVKGRKVQTHDGMAWSGTEAWSQNPAWIVADMLTHPEYGLGNNISRDDLDADSFKAWADWCDETVDLWTDAGDTEARFRFDGVFDSQAATWDALLQVCGTARATLVREGNTVRVVMFDDRSPSQIVNEGNVDDLRIAYANRNRRPNRVVVKFLNADKNYEQDQAVAEDEGLDESTDEIRETTVELYGITRATQANREAHFLHRAINYPIRTISFKASIALLQVQVGDVFGFTSETLRFGVAGARLAGDSGGNVLLDREVTFAADTIYTYYEQATDDDEILSRDFSYSSETTTDALDFAPLHGATGAVGRLYNITRKDHLDLYRVVRLGHVENDLQRRIDAVEHIPAAFTDDAPPFDAETVDPTLSSVTSASAVSVSGETSDEDDVSILEISFTPGSGARHIVHAEIGDAGRRRVGDGGATSPIEVRVRAPFQSPVTVYVQTVNADGARDASGDWPSATYTILREDGGQDVLDPPGDVTSRTLTPGAGNAATLSWAVPADGAVDGYEVRIGNWSGAKTLYDGSGTSLAIVRNPAGSQYVVKAVRDGIFSPDGIHEDDGAEHASYPTSVVLEDLDLKSDGTRNNLVAVSEWHRSGWGGAALQLVADLPVEYVSETFDLSTTAATHVGLNVMVLAYHDDPQPDWFFSSHLSFAGETAKEYVAWEAWIDHSPDGATWTPEMWTPNENMILTDRYFRVRLTGVAIPTEGESEDLYRTARIMIERIRVALYRA